MRRYRQPYETAGLQRRPKSDPLAPEDWERAMALLSILSEVPSTYQDRMVFQAGAPDGAFPALSESGRWLQ